MAEKSLAALMEEALQICERCTETVIVQADDTLAGLDEILRGKKAARAAVFTGRTSADRTGAYRAVLAALSCSDCATVRFREIPPEPDTLAVAAMTDFLRTVNPDCVIALGGGSVLDAAKAAYIAFQTDLPLAQCFGSNTVSNAFPNRQFARIIAIPTTSGTGSEVTQYSNIVNRERGVKQLISDPVLIPEYAFLRGEFTVPMPEDVTLATGFDALAHLLEGWLNVGQDAKAPWVNRCAEVGSELVKLAMPQVLANPDDRRARKAMQLAAALGGLTIRNKSTGLPHLASFSWFGRIAHGVAAARLLPAAWRYYIGSEAVVQRTLEIGRVFGGDTAEAVIAGYEQFLDGCNVPKLSAYPELDLALRQNTARSAGANRMKLELAPRPVPLDQSEAVLTAILDDAFSK